MNFATRRAPGHLRPGAAPARRRSRPRPPISATRCRRARRATPTPTSCATSLPRLVRGGRADHPRGRDLDGARSAVRGLAVGRVRAVHAGDPVVGVALPPGHPRQPPPPHHHHGHARVAGHDRRLRVVGRGAGVPRRRRAGDECRRGVRRRRRRPARLLRDRRRDRHPAAPREVLRGAGAAPVERCAPGPPRARREDGPPRERRPRSRRPSLRVGDRFVVRPG